MHLLAAQLATHKRLFLWFVLRDDLSLIRCCARDHRQAQGSLLAAETRASTAESEAKHRALLIENLKYTITKPRHEKFGQSSERGAILEQLELTLGMDG